MIHLQRLPIGHWVSDAVDRLTDRYATAFDSVTSLIHHLIAALQHALALLPPWMFIAVVVALALLALGWQRPGGWGLAAFSVIGLGLVWNLGYWQDLIKTLALVLAAEVLVLLLGIPLGILSAKSRALERLLRPVLDVMQTMPAFVYLVPAVILFGLGLVPGVISTTIFSLPPLIRLTSLGIRQVPRELVEATQSFGATWWQLLLKVQIPGALPSIMAGVNQSIMLGLSMVVISAMIGAGGGGQRGAGGDHPTRRRQGLRRWPVRGDPGHHPRPHDPVVGAYQPGETMMQRRLLMAFGAATAMAGWLPLPARAAAPPVRITYVRAWPSSNLTTHIATDILRKDMGQKVELVSTEAGPMWATVASGRADATLTAWLPTTHHVYWERYKHKLIDLGPVTSGTWLGLAVPSYVPLDSLSQIDSHHARFGDRIVGIEAGAGLMINTSKAIQAYHMRHMSLLTSSTAAMQEQLQRAIARKQWIVVTAWKPLGIWARFDLKPLQDPQHVYGMAGHIDAVINPRLQQRAPQVVPFLRALRLPIGDIQAMMVELDKGQTLPSVTAGWIAAHRAQIRSWVAAARA